MVKVVTYVFYHNKITGEKVHLRKQGHHRKRLENMRGVLAGRAAGAGPREASRLQGRERRPRRGSQCGDNERVRALEARRPRIRQWAAELWEHNSGGRWRAPPEEQRKEGEK